MALISASSPQCRKRRREPLFVFVAALLCSACDGGTPIDWSKVPNPDPGYQSEDAWIPYVEEVIFPDTIYAGEEFPVKLKLSAEFFPECLDGSRYFFFIGPQFLPPVGNNAWEIMPWCFPAPDSLPEDSPYAAAEGPTFTLTAPPAGEWVIGVDSAVSRELGGSKVRFNVIPGLAAFPDPAWEIRYYTITVVERPGDG